MALADLDIDGGTDIGAALVDADLIIVDDGAGGTNRKATLSRLMTYVNATLTQLSVSPVVTIKSRGKSITQAVDISQFIMKRMDTVGYFIKDVRISSDSLKSNDGKSRNVSTIEIDMSHK